MSIFITFEGGEGSGKSTQAKLLAERLRNEKRSVIHISEPGTTLLGKMLKAWLANKDSALTLLPGSGTQLSLIEPSEIDENLINDILLHKAAPRTELLAFTIARAQLVEEVIRPKLKNDNIIICDRYADSTVAYQGYGRGLDLELVNIANKIATQGIKPNLTILLDVPPEKGIDRKFKTRKGDHFEQQDLAFHKRVREGYLKLAAADPQRWLVIDGAKPIEEITQIIWERVSRLI